MTSTQINLMADGGCESHDARIMLFMQSGRNRELVQEALGDHFEIQATTDLGALESDFDCCVFDYSEFNRVAGTIQDRRDSSNSYFLPFVLLIERESKEASNPKLWEYLDDVIQLPAEKSGLMTRIQNLVDRRKTSVELAEREKELEATVQDLRLKERAMDTAPIGITIAEPGEEDYPLIYTNDQFQALTGYHEDVIGRDCRFLQGEETDPEAPRRIRAAIDAETSISIDILNYRKEGQRFWNKVDIAPLHDTTGTLTHFVGFQSDITERKIRERRLEVLNRVLGHNLRNKMNIVQGHVSLLRESIEDQTQLASLAAIAEASEDLFSLGESVGDIDRIISRTATDSGPVNLEAELQQLVSGLRDRHEDAVIGIDLPDDEIGEIKVPGLVRALREIAENAIVHNDSSAPSLEIRVTDRENNWIEFEIEDNGPGIPEQELQVLKEGESAVVHADRLGIWLVYWVVSRAGGSFHVTDAEPRGSVVHLAVPREIYTQFDD